MTKQEKTNLVRSVGRHFDKDQREIIKGLVNRIEALEKQNMVLSLKVKLLTDQQKEKENEDENV